MITFYCASVDDIVLGTRCYTGFTDQPGVVIDVDPDTRDDDGEYGVGYLIEWVDINRRSFISKSDITILRPEVYQFVG